MKNPLEIFFKPLSGFQFLLLICWFEIKTGVMVGDYFYSIFLVLYICLYVTWKNMIKPGKKVNITWINNSK